MFEKINCTKIVCDHMSTLVDARTGKLSTFNFIYLFGIPACIGTIGYLYDGFLIGDEARGAIITALFLKLLMILKRTHILIEKLFPKEQS